jgi:hypothetical protein
MKNRSDYQHRQLYIPCIGLSSGAIGIFAVLRKEKSAAEAMGGD